MKAGNLKFFFITIFFVLFASSLFSQDNLILENLEPTFEEDTEVELKEETDIGTKIKSKSVKKIITSKTIVNFRALDNITAKTSDINIVVGQKKKFGYLEIFPRKCSRSQTENDNGVTAYIQVKDLSDKKEDKVFIFNGWTFSSSPTLKTFDHPVYDLWITGCENI